MFSNGMVNALVHLDQCIHEVKGDLVEMKGGIKRMEEDFTNHRKLINDAIQKRLPEKPTTLP